jgi:hypothetical protein
MAAKKKTKRKKKTRKTQTKSQRTTGKKVAAMKKTIKKKLRKLSVTPKKKLAKRRAALKKAKVKTKGGESALNKQVQETSQSVDTVAFALEGLEARSGEQSGDLQGLSNVQGADSESVDELLEEGNAFEAEAVKGVEDAELADEKEVRTHEVPQDDVPGEYLG